MWVGRSVILLPSEAHTNPLPLNQSLPPPSSLTPPSPDAEPCFPVCMLPHAANWLNFNRFSPYKRKDKKGNKGIALQKSLEATRKEGRINLPLSTAPMPPLWVGLGNPHLDHNSIKYQYPSLPLLTIWEPPPQQSHLSGRRRVGMRRIGWRRTKVLNKYFCAKLKKKKERGGVLPELCVVASPLGPTTASPSSSSSSTSPISSCNLAFLAWCQYTLGEKGKIIANRIKVAKYGYLHEMEPLCFIWRWGTHYSQGPRWLHKDVLCTASVLEEDTHFWNL